MSLTVGVADMKVVRDHEGQMITYALGSCVGVTVYDPVARVGGMLHAMLPLSSIDPEKAAANAAMFVDSGLTQLLVEFYKLGAQKSRMVVVAAGGACMGNEQSDDFFQIGSRNVIVVKKMLWKNSILLNAQEFGGNESRSMIMDLQDGQVMLRDANRVERVLFGGGRPPAGPLPSREPARVAKDKENENGA
jgi:chemotaxis protein CheD